MTIFCARCGESIPSYKWEIIADFAGVVSSRKLHAEATVRKHRICGYVAVCVYKPEPRQAAPEVV